MAIDGKGYRSYISSLDIQEVDMPPKKKRTNSEPRARLIHIRLKPETHKRLRIRAAEEDVSIQDWVATLIETGLAEAKTADSRDRG